MVHAAPAVEAACRLCTLRWSRVQVLLKRGGEWEHVDASVSILSGGNADEKKFRAMAAKKGMKKCPSCRMWVDKNKGCDAMVCFLTMTCLKLRRFCMLLCLSIACPQKPKHFARLQTSLLRRALAGVRVWMHILLEMWRGCEQEWRMLMFAKSGPSQRQGQECRHRGISTFPKSGLHVRKESDNFFSIGADAGTSPRAKSLQGGPLARIFDLPGD